MKDEKRREIKKRDKTKREGGREEKGGKEAERKADAQVGLERVVEEGKDEERATCFATPLSSH